MIAINAESLKKAVSIVGNAVERSTTLPILGHILCTIDTDAQTITIAGTNLEQTISSRIEIQCDPTDSIPPRFTLPYDKIKGLLNANRAQQLQLNVGDLRATIKAGNARFQLHLFPPNDFPDPPEAKREQLVIEGAALRAAIDATLPAAARPGNEVRFYLCGILCEHDGKTLTMVATDGHRMHISAIPHAAENPSSFIIPRASAIAMSRLIPDQEITLHMGETDICADLGDTHLHTKLIDGRYPDWRRVVPSGSRARIACNSLALQQGIASCSVLSNEDYHGIKITLSPDDKEAGIHLSATNKAQEQSDDQIAAAVEGDALEVGFNAGYLSQALGAIPGADSEISIADNNAAAIIRPAQNDGAAETYAVVMAMRL